jgi:ATP-dependent DNA helicase RecG
MEAGTPPDYWQQDIMFLKGVGPKRAAVLASECGIETYGDLLHYYPRRHIDRSRPTPIAALREEGQLAVVIGRLGRFEFAESGRTQQLRVTLSDGNDYLQLSWFKGARFIAQKYREGEPVVVYGRVTFFRDKPQMAHPEMESLLPDQDPVHALKLTPLYPSTEALKRQGLDSRGFRSLTWRLLQDAPPDYPEVLPAWLLDRYGLPPLGRALRQIHFPDTWTEHQAAERRLKFDELLLFELLMVRRRHLRVARSHSPQFTQIGRYFNRFYSECLPFELTNAQKRVIREIRHDVNRSQQMNRLIQGDVGSGKTIVAVLAMLMALDNGFQAALMAPTEILAEQHFRTIHHLVEPLGINVALLTGGVKARLKKSTLASLANGQTHIAVGTHALIQEAVHFHNLGLTIIDEQHKFGVLQRAQLWAKATRPPHNIAMSATPIPRTLALSVYGDIDVSVIDELPPGRQPVKTVVRREGQRLAVFGFLREQMQAGRQVYVVYPLVEESSKLDLLAATEGYTALERYFTDFRLTLVHGRMDSEAKDYEMMRFKRGEVQLLVSTTVIEVGVLSLIHI